MPQIVPSAVSLASSPRDGDNQPENFRSGKQSIYPEGADVSHSGFNIAKIDSIGIVHPETFWWHQTSGKAEEGALSEVRPVTSDSGFCAPAEVR